MKPSKSKRPASARQPRYRLTADREGGLPIPEDMARDMNIRVGDDYAIWKMSDGWRIVFLKHAKPGVKIPKHAERRKVERALPDEPPRTSGAALARRLRQMKPQPEAAKAVADAIRQMDPARKPAKRKPGK